MRSIPTIRRFDDLGRIVIPKEVRKLTLGTERAEGIPMEVFYDGNGQIILKQHIPERETFYALSKLIEQLLNNAPVMDDCSEAENRIYSEITNLQNLLVDNEYDVCKGK